MHSRKSPAGGKSPNVKPPDKHRKAAESSATKTKAAKAKPSKATNAKSGKLSRLEPRPQTYFMEQHGGRGRDGKPLEKVLAALKNYREVGPNQWVANCPCPDCHDTGEHLNVYLVADGRGQKLNNGDVVLRCYHAGCDGGCTLNEIVDALGLQMRDLFARGPDDGKRPVCGTPAVPRREAPLYKTLGKTAPPRPGTLCTAPDAERDWATMVQRFRTSLTKHDLRSLVEKLGVTPASLNCLDIGITTSGYTFPEFNGVGEVVGISLRTFTGDKCMLPGSRRGIYIPQGWWDRSDPLLVVEGASDVAAATMMGFAALGRPDCSSGAKQLAEVILTGAYGHDPKGVLFERNVVVMGENDAKPDGRWPGKTGAVKVAEELSWHLGRPVPWALPGKAKDFRAWAIALKQKERTHAKG